MVLVLCEVDEVHPILLAVETELLRPLLAIVNNNLVVRTARDDVHAIVTVVKVGDLVRVVFVQLRHPHGPYNIVNKFHLEVSGPPRQLPSCLAAIAACEEHREEGGEEHGEEAAPLAEDVMVVVLV